MVGKIVISRSGRDKDKKMVIVAETENYLLVCDGKERRLERPKRKNPKHLQFTDFSLKPHQFETNRALRKALKCCGYEEEK
ncbi:MAG: KOW domain-containing RNA-binding protein [Clostridia bacterium]|nr:KOW domain-containing RNA-binding protein [Clostridia bacterium]